MNLIAIRNCIGKNKRALLDEGYTIYIQPKYDTPSKAMVGGEALIRRISKDGRIILPGEFIDSFERSGFIKYIDLFVIDRACHFQRHCLNDNLSVKPISCNLSKVSFLDDGYIDCICDIVDSYGIPNELIEFEITESAFAYGEETISIIKELKSRGFSVACDDFGKGFSCLSVLQRDLFDYIKIDKEFLSNKHSKDDISVILSHIIAMAQELGIKTICEGVETLSHVSMLEELNCDMLQGFYYSEPLSVNDYLDVEQVKKVST